MACRDIDEDVFFKALWARQRYLNAALPNIISLRHLSNNNSLKV